MVVLRKFAAASTLLVLAGACTPTTNGATAATEAEICRAWRDSLPTRSSRDTEQTRAEIGTAYDVQAAACPAFPRF